MRSSAIMALFQASPMLLGIAALSGLYPMTAAAQSAPLQPIGAVQAVAKAEPSNNAGAAGSFGVLKTPTSPAQKSDVRIQPSLAASQPMAIKGVVPGESSGTSLQSAVDGVELLTPAQRRIYQRAASAFSLFCHDWDRMLHEREVNNLDHLSWRKDGDLETATYTGYGKVESCVCKASKEGLPIGKIRYQERNYSIAGKTAEEARHAIPKLTHEINALEIFSWDKGKWFY